MQHNLTPYEAAVLAALAQVDPRTACKWANGGRVRPSIRRRLERAVELDAWTAHRIPRHDAARGLSEAEALRRLYRRAMGVDELVQERDRRGRSIRRWTQVRGLTEREREVLDGTDRVAPVTFHAGRNAFAQGCDDAGLSDEQTRELLDHENVKVTQGYQRRLARRAKDVPNVHPDLDRRLASRERSGRRESAQAGHIGARTPRHKNDNPGFHRGSWLRGQDLNLRPSGYEEGRGSLL
jgi:hypothetical protein